MYYFSLSILIAASGVLFFREQLSRWHVKLPAVIVILLAFGSYGLYASNLRVNSWDSFHYYVGAKYFNELSYFNLYECATIVDSQNPNWIVGLSNRTITNLKNNKHLKADSFLHNPQHCLSKFSPARWQEFSQDIAFFRDRMGYRKWNMALADRGFNATPFWTSYAHIIFNNVSLSEKNIISLVRIDHILLLLGLLLILWNFGPISGGVVSILMLTLPFLESGWVLGGIFRLDWLLVTILSVIAIKKEWYLAAGFFLALSIGLRLYPAIFLFGLSVYSFYHYKDKMFIPLIKNFVIGLLIGGVFMLNLISSQFSSSVFSDSYNNLKNLQGAVLTNKVGVNSILGYSDSTRLELTFERKIFTAHEKWKRGVAKNQRDRRIAFYIISGVILLLLIYSMRNLDLVGSYVSSLALIIAIDPLNYYYVILPLLTLAVYKDNRFMALIFLPSVVGTIYYTVNPEVVRSVVLQDKNFLVASYISVSVVLIFFALKILRDNRKSLL